jgi:hypothetical protein
VKAASLRDAAKREKVAFPPPDELVAVDDVDAEPNLAAVIEHV